MNPSVTLAGGRTVDITGNGWQMVDLEAIEITADTVLAFDFRSSVEGEIHGIGFDNDRELSADLTFQLHGITENWSTSQQLENYQPTAPGTKRYVVNVGEFYTGSYRYLFFINDDDADSAGQGVFSNIHIYKSSPAQKWADAMGLDPLGGYGLGDDANSDGRANVFDFAFAGDPKSANPAAGSNVRNGVLEEGGNKYLTVTAPFRPGATFSGTPLVSNAVDGVVYGIYGDGDLDVPLGEMAVEEVSPALDAGLPALGDLDGTPGADWIYRTFRIAAPMSGQDHGFLWIGASEAP